MPPKTMLVIGAHLDDTEYGAGGLIVQAVRRGWRVVSIVLCGDHGSWQPTLGREDMVRDRLLEVSAIMGVEKTFFGTRYHRLWYNEEEVQRLAQIVAEMQPDLGLVPWPHDHWPDHVAAGKIGLHAMRFPHSLRATLQPVSRILMYEAGPRQADVAVPFRPNLYVDITNEIDRACESLHEIDEIVADQAIAGLSSHEQDKRAKSLLRGTECGVAYAEAFVALQVWPQDILGSA
jgi:LmbE family N-acetylglucosaminyl deacetylase